MTCEYEICVECIYSSLDISYLAHDCTIFSKNKSNFFNHGLFALDTQLFCSFISLLFFFSMSHNSVK